MHTLLLGLVGTALLTMATPLVVNAQDNTRQNRSRSGRESKQSTTDDLSLAAQVQDLQIKVDKLEAALKQKHAGMQDRSMQDKMPRGMGKKGGKRMAPMSGKPMSGTRTMREKKGMKSAQSMGKQAMGGTGMSGMAMMGRMKGMGPMQTPSALPGFPGASHIYHIGATSFFLDHSQHITLTREQQATLQQIKEKVLLGQATFDRWIEQAEQEIWVLTSSDAPDAAAIEAKIREVAKLGADKRIAYIRAVGEAAKVLTDEQRQSLVGTLPPEHAAAGTDDEPREP